MVVRLTAGRRVARGAQLQGFERCGSLLRCGINIVSSEYRNVAAQPQQTWNDDSRAEIPGRLSADVSRYPTANLFRRLMIN